VAGYELTHVTQIDEIENFSSRVRPVRHHFGISTFGVTAWTGHAVGDRIINDHAEDEPESSEELYVVLTGRARFEIAGESRDAPAGTLIHIPANMRRTAFAQEPETTIIVVGTAPDGIPYTASGWEVLAPLWPLFESGDHEEGIRRSQALLAEDPPYGQAWYMAACFESLGGQTDEALAHLRRALELEPGLAGHARGNPGLAALHDDPAFKALVAGAEAGDE
jgi:mannose-6-phosphate isomerase-like protein (cupin superfamily)